MTVPSDTAFDEATHITFNDVAVDRLKEPTIVRRLKTSKTDHYEKWWTLSWERQGMQSAQSLQC